MNCDCARCFEVRLARADDYASWKKILDIGKHPAFIGRTTFAHNAINGGALFYDCDEQPVAVSLVNPHHSVLLVLNILPEYRSHGLGSAIVNFLMPNFARVLESKVEWFEARGYRSVSKLKAGRALNTQLMARAALFDLAGKLRATWNNCASQESHQGESRSKGSTAMSRS